MNDETKLPELHNTPEELAAEEVRKRDEELRKYWLDPTIDYPEPHHLFEYHGVGFSPLGGIQAISGQKKNGKTFVLAQLMAVALGNGTDRVNDYLPGLTLNEDTVEWLGHEPRVLYCDTEMEQLNSAKVFRRVHWLCGWDMKIPSDRFAVLWLREVPPTDKSTTNKERWRLIKNGIDSFEPDIVFVDGLRDLVNDFNDNEESSQIINEMMSLASRKNLSIWNVLHMNPRPSNDDESKMRGHLGTELGNKVSDTFISVKKKDATTGEVTFSVKQLDARGKDVDDWKFKVVDDAGELGVPKIIEKATSDTADGKRADDPSDILDWINAAADDPAYEWPLTRKEIKDMIFRGIGKQTNKDMQQADLSIAIEKEYLIESAVKVKGYNKLLPNPDRPFYTNSIQNGRENGRYLPDAD